MLKNLTLVSFILVFLLTFILYIPGISPSVFGGDSGDIILAAYTAGIAHPQGYPLNTMIGWIFTHLPYDATVAYKANLMVAFFQALNVGLAFLITRLLTKNLIVSIVSSLILAFTPIFWLYAHVAEVFQLTVLLIGLSSYFLLLWRENFLKKNKRAISDKYLHLSTFIFGLAFFHHFITLLVIPAFVYIVFKTEKKILIDFKKVTKLFVLFLLGLLPYLFIPFSILQKTPINWAGSLSVINFLRLISRADYGSFNDFQDLAGLSPFTKIFQLQWYFNVLKADFTIFGLFLVLAGLVFLFTKYRDLFWFLTLAFFFTGPFFILYTSFSPFETFIQGIFERFFLFGYFFLVIIIGFGILAIVEYSKKFFNQKIQKKYVLHLVVPFVFILFPISLLVINFPKTDLSEYRLGQYFGEDLLASASPPGFLFLQGDSVLFNTQYSYYVDEINPESIVVMTGRLKRPAYRYVLANEHPEVNYPDEFFEEGLKDLSVLFREIVLRNENKFAVYSNVQADAIPEGYVWIREGLLYRMYPKDKIPGADELLDKYERNFKNFVDNIEEIDNQYTHFIPEDFRKMYSAALTSGADTLFSRELYGESEKYYLLAVKASDNLAGPKIGLGDIHAEKKNCPAAENHYMKALETGALNNVVYQRLITLSEDCFNDANKADLYAEMLKKNSKFDDSFRESEIF